MVYMGKLNVPIIWQFDNHKKYLKDDVTELIDNKNEKDKRLDDGYKRTKLRKICFNLLRRIMPAQNGQNHTSQIRN